MSLSRRESEQASERKRERVKRRSGTLSVSLYFQSCMARGKIATTTATTTNIFFTEKTNLLKPANRKTGFSCFCRVYTTLYTPSVYNRDTIACLCYYRSTNFYYAVTLATKQFACMYRVVVLMIFRFATITVIS